VPRTQLKIEEAEQATDYVNYIVMVENPGFQIFMSVFKDALVRKTGIFKWYPDYTAKITEQEYTGSHGRHASGARQRRRHRHPFV
jgi:hypothetical protein